MQPPSPILIIQAPTLPKLSVSKAPAVQLPGFHRFAKAEHQAVSEVRGFRVV